MVTKQQVHALVDQLPEETLPAAERLLRSLHALPGGHLRWSLLLAPEDDEPLTPEEEEALAEAREDVRQGRTVSNEDMRRPITAMFANFKVISMNGGSALAASESSFASSTTANDDNSPSTATGPVVSTLTSLP